MIRNSWSVAQESQCHCDCSIGFFAISLLPFTKMASRGTNFKTKLTLLFLVLRMLNLSQSRQGNNLSTDPFGLKQGANCCFVNFFKDRKISIFLGLRLHCKLRPWTFWFHGILRFWNVFIACSGGVPAFFTIKLATWSKYAIGSRFLSKSSSLRCTDSLPNCTWEVVGLGPVSSSSTLNVKSRWLYTQRVRTSPNFAIPCRPIGGLQFSVWGDVH